jgi:hypothetical protein
MIEERAGVEGLTPLRWPVAWQNRSGLEYEGDVDFHGASCVNPYQEYRLS